MIEILGSTTTLHSINQTLQRIEHSFISIRSVVAFVLSILAALLIGRVIAALLRRVVWAISRRADKSRSQQTVMRLRRYETMIVLSIALIRTILVILALYFWWQFVHPSGQPTAIIGSAALAAVVISGALSAPLRDFAYGSLMMAEQWYGVGDHIRVEPFMDLQGVVERVTLRSTRIRGLNGEIIWLANQSIQGVRIAPKGIRTLALEIFVTDLKAGEQLIDKTNKRLPIGPLLVVTPLQIVSSEEVGENLWHITAIGETAPGREWLLEQSATELVKTLDAESKHPVIAHGPLARYADRDAEKRFTRTIANARKAPAPKRSVRSGVGSRKRPTTNKSSKRQS